MGQISDNMIRSRVEVKDFFSIAKEHPYFLWHFLQKKQSEGSLAFFSYFDEPEDGKPNILKYTIDELPLPYFESYVDESIDFLLGLGFSSKQLYKPQYDELIYIPRERFYLPFIVGFNRYKKISSTKEICYCPEGVVEVVLKMNPDLILNAD